MATTTTPLTNGQPSTDGQAAPPLSSAANGTSSRIGHTAPTPDAAPAPPFQERLRDGETQPQPPTADGRDPATGRFLKGAWRGGPGNPFFRRLAQLRAQAVCEITPDELRCLVRKLYEHAMAGDTPSAVVLLAYVIGKPAKVVDPDAVDDDQWRRMRDVPSQEEFAAANINRIPTEAAIGKLQQIRELCDPFDKAKRPNAQLVLDEINQQRKRRK
jgi:hypothetical protein